MSSIRMINVGCGERFLAASEWINLDFSSRSPAVATYNLLKGIPLPSDFADLVYSSHVLEHFDKHQAAALLLEMKRVVKPGGYVRIVVPDLEEVCINYLDAVAKLRAGGRPEQHRW